MTDIDDAVDKRIQKMELQKQLNEICENGRCTKDEQRKNYEELKRLIKGKEKINCPDCGGQHLELGNSYCPNCGTEIGSYDELPGFVPYSKRRR